MLILSLLPDLMKAAMSYNRRGFLTDLAGSRWEADEALVTDLQHGDLGAAEYAVQRYAAALYRYAYYQLQDAALAEDLVAEVMTRMLQHIDSFVPASIPFAAWLFRIARNLVADHYRARKRRPQVSLERWLASAPGEEPGRCDEHIDGLPEREVLRAGLTRLTEEQRQVVLLHVVEGWELPQVAQLLDRTLPSVKSLYYRGMQTLRRALSREDSSLH